MKGYFVTEKQMQDLHEQIELSYRRAKTGHNTNVLTFDDLYRSINFTVHRWVNEIGKN